MQRTALMLGRYQINTAVLSETRFTGEMQVEEVGRGYTYCIRKSDNAPRTSCVGFAIHTKTARQPTS